MALTWIVSANAGRVRVFSGPNVFGPLEEIRDMINDAARLRTSETESDVLGQRSASKSRHSLGAPTPESGYEPNQLPADHQTEIFARDVVDFLRASHEQGRFEHLVLAASPEFLGVLRKQLGPELQAAITLQINKDYTHLRTQELLERIQMQARDSARQT